MPFTENQVYEALGLEIPTGAEGQGVADPEGQASSASSAGTDTGADGAQDQPVAEAGVENTDTAGSGSAPETDTETDTGDVNDDADTDPGDSRPADHKPQTPEQRRANAARRREAEQKAAIDEAVQKAVKAEQEKHNAQMEQFFQQTGMKNTFTDQPIRTMEEFHAWQEQFSQQRIQQDLKAGKLTPEALQQAVAAHPAVKQAAQIVEQASQVQKQQKDAADKARIDAEFAQIATFDPDIRTPADLVKVPEFAQIKEMVDRGYRIADAVKLARGQVYSSRATEAARQQALNNTRSKDHLQGTGNARGAGAVSVPSDVMASFRLFNPGATDAQIQQFYNSYLKSKG